MEKPIHDILDQGWPTHGMRTTSGTQTLSKSCAMAAPVDAGLHGLGCTALLPARSPERDDKGHDRAKIEEWKLGRSRGKAKPPKQAWRGLKYTGAAHSR